MQKYTKWNAGLSYETLNGKEKPARKITILASCRAKCMGRISPEIQANIFEEYWSLGSRDKRASFVSSLVGTTEPKVMRKSAEDPEKEKYRQYTHQFHLKTQEKMSSLQRVLYENFGTDKYVYYLSLIHI